MLNSDKIEEIIVEFSDILKVTGVDNKGEFRKPPNFNPIYQRCIELADEIKVHSRGEHFPARLFEKKIPNESEEMRDYRESIYRPYTKSVWKRGIVNYDRVFNKQNFSITGWSNNTGVFKNETAENYFKKEYPRNGNITSYYNQIVKNIKNEDPNSVIGLWIDDIQDVPDTELLKPYGKVYECFQRIFFTDHYEVILSNERSIVTFNKSEKRIGFILYIYDDENIYKVKQLGQFSDFKFEWIVYYNHGLGFLPIRVLGGVPEKIGDLVIYHSHAEDSIYSLDDIAIDKSTLQASKISHAFLEKWEAMEDCPDTNCSGGFIFEGEKRVKCSICEGTGKFNSDILKRYIVSIREGMTTTPITPPAGYIDKDPSILEFLQGQIISAEKSSFLFLGVDVSNDNVSGKSDVAMTKMIDRETLFSNLMGFSDEIFDLMEFEIKFSGQTRYNDFQEPEIKKPINFALRGERDLTLEYSEAKKNGLPDEYLSPIFKQLNIMRFSADQNKKRIDEIAQYVDSLYLKDTLQVNSMLSTRQIPVWKSILHYSFDTYLVRKVNENKEYLDTKNEEIKTEFEGMAKVEAEELKIGTTEQILE